MRTTIRLDEQLLTEVKTLASQTGQSMTAIIEEALRVTLARKRQVEKRPYVKLTTVGGEGLMPGVDLDNSAALLDLMETDDPA